MSDPIPVQTKVIDLTNFSIWRFHTHGDNNTPCESEEDITSFNAQMKAIGSQERFFEIGDKSMWWTKRGNKTPATWRKLLDECPSRMENKFNYSES